MMPHRVDVVVAHVKSRGEPCTQGGSGDLPEDYPRDELVGDDGWWDLVERAVPAPVEETTIGTKPAVKRKRKKRHLAVVT
jgi:hypothetical protein